MKKQQIRQQMRQQRECISSLDREEKSRNICSFLEQDEYFQHAKNILFFAPAFSEPNIFPLAKKYLDKKDVSFPRIYSSSNLAHQRSTHNSIRAKKVTTLSELLPGSFGILEPNKNLPDFSSQELDLILLPALAIDKNGNRLGFGGGFYDRFLPTLSAKKFAVIYDFQLIDSLPSEPHDIPVDAFVTEERIKKIAK